MAANSDGGITWLIACLGNPGDKYTYTRHNAGFLTADYISQKCSVKLSKLKYKALINEISLGGQRAILMKPQTFMNSSGEAVKECADFYKIPPENILVIFDDVELPVGKLRIRKKGSDGGHNGIKSIITCLSSDSFPRIKIGVGKKPSPDYDLVAWVLGQIPKADREEIFIAIENAYNSAELILSGNIEKAMNSFN